MKDHYDLMATLRRHLGPSPRRWFEECWQPSPKAASKGRCEIFGRFRLVIWAVFFSVGQCISILE